MKLIFSIGILLFLTSCFQQSNSSSGDASLAQSVDAAATEKFRQVYQITRENCFGCHDHSFENLTTEAQWMAAKSNYGQDLFTAEDADGSYFISRTRNCGSGAQADMPDNGESISSEDCAIIKEWINQYQQ